MVNAGQKRKLLSKGNFKAWFVIGLLVVCTCMPLASHAQQRTHEGPGWDTPEEAVLLYLEGLKEQDMDKMISAYAVETLVDHFDLTAQLMRIRAYTMFMTPRMPNTSNLIRGINIEARRNEIVQSIFLQLNAICLPDMDFSAPTTFGGEDFAEEIAAFVEGLERGFGAVDFGTLKFLRFTPPELISEMYASERNQENIQAQVAPFGADEARSVVAVFLVDGRFGTLTCDVARYGDRWFMFKPGGNIGAMIGLSAQSAGMVAVPLKDVLLLRGELDGPAQEILDEILGELMGF